MSNFIDITFPVSKNLPVWPGSAGFSRSWNNTIPKNPNFGSEISFDSHFGTHIDAPFHFVTDGKTIDQLLVDDLIGEVRLCEISNTKVISSRHLDALNLPASCRRVIFKTDNQKLWINQPRVFNPDFVALDISAAEWLVNKGITFVGIDYLSIQRFYDGPEVHQILLNNEVVIAESLDLSQVSSGTYDLICLPMLIQGAEAAPARILLKHKS